MGVSVAAGVSGDKLDQWEAPGTMVCGEYTVGQLWVGSKSKDQAVEELQAANKTAQTVLRFIFWLLCWAAFYMTFYPLYTVIDIAGDWLDNIPYIGDFIEDFIEGLAGTMMC